MKSNIMDAILLLGLRLENGTDASEELVSRVKTAAEAYRAGRADMIIACGGKIEEHEKTEAEVMEALLVREGVDLDSIVREEKSSITYENILNAKALLKKEKPRVLVVTSDYHARRARLLCRMLGLSCESEGAFTPENEEKRTKRRLEWLLIIDTLLGNQNPRRKRSRLMAFLGRVVSKKTYRKLNRPQPKVLQPKK